MQVANLQGLHDKIYLGTQRAPLFQVLMYDQSDSLSDIVLGDAKQRPMDITKYITDISMTEDVESATTVNLSLVSDGTISPYHFVGRRIIRILYGDEATFKTYKTPLVPIFTGVAQGQPGYRRKRNEPDSISVKCIDRSFFYNKRKLQSKQYLQGIDLGDIAVDIATNGVYGMGLQREEVRFGKFDSLVEHSQVTFLDVGFFEGLSLISFMVDKEPGWDGKGFLVMFDTSLDKAPVRVYKDENLFFEIEWPQTEVDLFNCVKVIGQSSVAEKIASPQQELAQITGTVGYFQSSFEQRVYFSEDRQARAEGIFISDYSINGQLGTFFGSKPKLKKITEFSCVVVINTPYQAFLFIVFFAVYIAFFVVSAFIPILEKIAFVAAAAWLSLGLALMQQLGTFDVTISGIPFKYVYKEVEGRACWTTLFEYEVREKEIFNHLVHSEELAKELADRELRRETIKGMVRKISLPFDPFLKKFDIIELPDGTRYMLKSISRTFKRNEAQNMDIEAYAIRSGKEFNQQQGFSNY